MDQGVLMIGSGTLVNHHHSPGGHGSVLPTQNNLRAVSGEAWAQGEVVPATRGQKSRTGNFGTCTCAAHSLRLSEGSNQGQWPQV